MEAYGYEIFRNKLLVILMYVSSFIAFTINVKAEPWNGIYPLKSSRSEVEKILGKCKTENHPWRCLYELEDKNVIIYYVDEDCKNEGLWNVPMATVESIVIHFHSTKKQKIADLQIDTKGFSEDEDPELVGFVNFNNKDRGMDFVVRGNNVESLYFYPGKAEREKLSCVCKSLE